MHYMVHILLGEFSEMKTDGCHPVKGMKYEGCGLELHVFGGCNMCATADHSGFTVSLSVSSMS